ncbi:MAG: RDD family protein [Elusimicrobiota bacterium]|nr:RDD family protein [Elusimicrobiota bacterium]
MDEPERVVELRAARFSDRLVAYLLDTAPFGAGAVLTGFVWGGPLRRPLGPDQLASISAAWIVAALFYQFLANAAGGGVGKRLMGLRVLTKDGAPVGPLRALGRALAWALSTPLCNFGFLVALLRADNRTLHDLLAGTVVVEAYPKGRGEGALLFVAALTAALGLFGLNAWMTWLKPTPDDLLAQGRAREGLDVLARIQEAHKAAHGSYTNDLSELAQASGDAAQFDAALTELFDRTSLRIEAGNVGYRMAARAKDRRRTLVTLNGP